jgi:hypothetical protein
MSTLNLTFVESIQLVLFGFCAFYAMTAYALRRERVLLTDSLDLNLFELKQFACFTLVTIIAIMLNVCKQGRQEDDDATKQDVGGGESDTEKLSGGSLSNGHTPRRVCSMEERISVGNRRSIWDGGTKGARRGTGALKSASKRGIAAERKSAEEAMGESQLDEDESDDVVAISPGFV